MHDITLTQIALFLAAAVVAAPIAKLLRIGNVLGYLLVGVLIGPSTLGPHVLRLRGQVDPALRRVRRRAAAVRDRPRAAPQAPVGHAQRRLRPRQRAGRRSRRWCSRQSRWRSALRGRPHSSPAWRSRSPRPRLRCSSWRRRAISRAARAPGASPCCCSRTWRRSRSSRSRRCSPSASVDDAPKMDLLAALEGHRHHRRSSSSSVATCSTNSSASSRARASRKR